MLTIILSIFPVIDHPGFNDAAYNWETFESNTFFSLFTTNSEETKYGFDIRLTCQKPIPKKDTTFSGEKCLKWSDIFEEWPKAEIDDFGNRTFEFLPSFSDYGMPMSLYNKTYITWEDNRSCDNLKVLGSRDSISILLTDKDFLTQKTAVIKVIILRCRKISDDGQPGCFVPGGVSK